MNGTYPITKEEFKLRWEKPDGGGITFDDIAACAIAWGITQRPKTKIIYEVRYAVLKAAGVKDAEDFHPESGTP